MNLDKQSGLLLQVQDGGWIRQFTGSPGEHLFIDTTSTVTSFMMFADRTRVWLSEGAASSQRRVRLLLWSKLGSTPPTMQQTFRVDSDVIGEEIVRMPPFAPLNSFVHVTVSFSLGFLLVLCSMFCFV